MQLSRHDVPSYSHQKNVKVSVYSQNPNSFGSFVLGSESWKLLFEYKTFVKSQTKLLLSFNFHWYDINMNQDEVFKALSVLETARESFNTDLREKIWRKSTLSQIDRRTDIVKPWVYNITLELRGAPRPSS